MSEFKFACPVCGQHLCAPADQAGGQVECPTCFRKIVVPQAPSSPDTKLLLSASQVSQRPLQETREASGVNVTPRKAPAFSWGPTVAAVILTIAAAGAIWWFRTYRVVPPPPPITTEHSAPQETRWNLDLAQARIPEKKVSGKLLGKGFVADKASLGGNNLALTQDPGTDRERQLVVYLYSRKPEDLAGKSLEVRHDRAGPRPRVVVTLQSPGTQSVTQTFTEGYALKMELGHPVGGHLSGALYLALPDGDSSWIAGRFEAAIETPNKPANTNVSGTSDAPRD